MTSFLCLKIFIRRLASTVFLIGFLSSSAFSQCIIDREKLGWSEDGLFYKYGYLCPAYFFSYKGDTSKKWNIAFANIDIKQAPANTLKFKRKVDRAIKNYAGASFFKNLKFSNVEICYPERLKAFKDSGAGVTLAHYKSRYTYYYSFQPDTMTGYNITIAVTSSGEIITPFIFPSKRDYKPIITNFTYCQLLALARKKQKHIDPIDKISFEYDKKRKKFFWLISQSLINEQEGKNNVNTVYIDAADFKKIITVSAPEYVIY